MRYYSHKIVEWITGVAEGMRGKEIPRKKSEPCMNHIWSEYLITYQKWKHLWKVFMGRPVVSGWLWEISKKKIEGTERFFGVFWLIFGIRKNNRYFCKILHIFKMIFRMFFCHFHEISWKLSENSSLKNFGKMLEKFSKMKEILKKLLKISWKLHWKKFYSN